MFQEWCGASILNGVYSIIQYDRLQMFIMSCLGYADTIPCCMK